MKFVERNKEMRKITRGDVLQVYLPDKNSSGKCVEEGNRPVVVISNDVCNSISPVITVLPCSSSMRKINKGLPTHVVIDEEDLEVSGLSKKSVVMAEQFISIDRRDIQTFLGHLPEKYMPKINRAASVQIALA